MTEGIHDFDPFANGGWSREALDAVTDLVFVKAPGSRLVWANRAFLAFYGMSNEELRGIVDAPFVPPDFTQKYVRDDAYVFETGNVLDIPDEPIQKADGTVCHVHTVKSPVKDPSGKVTFLVGISRDISERRQLEMRLNITKRLTSVGTLASGVAHEINNPLAYVLMNLDSMANELAGDASSFSEERFVEFRAMVEEAREGALRVRDTVKDLQTFARSDEKRNAPVDLPRVLDCAQKLARHEIHLRARLEVTTGDVPRVLGNEGQLAKVFVNLLLNAAQATPEGDTANHVISVVTGTTENGSAFVEIRDTAGGISADVLPRIFDPFFTTRAVGDGAGLGLPLVHNIVSAHGGTVSVETREGVGSTFRVVLPAYAEVTTHPATKAAAMARAKKPRVLVVDDEPLVVSAIRRILSKDHDVVTLYDAKTALAALVRGDSYDAIVCDLMMPNMTGMDFYEAVRKVAPGIERRFVFVTGGAFSTRARTFLDVIPNPTLSKPLSRDVLRDAIRDVLV
ncbi:MAG: PAS domain-containing protein [Polyangiaceae bacterium]